MQSLGKNLQCTNNVFSSADGTTISENNNKNQAEEAEENLVLKKSSKSLTQVNASLLFPKIILYLK